MKDKEIECMINRKGTSYAFAKLAPVGAMKNTIVFFIYIVLTYNSFGQCNNEQIFDRMEIDFQDFFKNDTITICVNGFPILEEESLTSDEIIGYTRVTVIITNFELPYSIVLTSTVKITTILNGYEENFDIDLNKGLYIGFSKKRDGSLYLLQSKIPFEYD